MFRDKLSAASTFAHHFPPSLGKVGGWVGGGAKMCHTFESNCTFTCNPGPLAVQVVSQARWRDMDGRGGGRYKGGGQIWSLESEGNPKLCVVKIQIFGHLMQSYPMFRRSESERSWMDKKSLSRQPIISASTLSVTICINCFS